MVIYEISTIEYPSFLYDLVPHFNIKNKNVLDGYTKIQHIINSVIPEQLQPFQYITHVWVYDEEILEFEFTLTVMNIKFKQINVEV